MSRVLSHAGGVVAGAAAVPAAPFAVLLPDGPDKARGETLDADPVHAAIAVHARAYAAYEAQLAADVEDDLALEPLCKVEHKAANALAATVPGTLAGAATALAYVRALNDSGYPLLDDYGCYLLIAWTETALRRVLVQP